MDDLLEALQFAEARLEELGEHELVGKCAAAFAKYKAEQEPVACYAYQTIEEYEDLCGMQVNDAFKIGWNMARTTNAMLGIKAAPVEPVKHEPVAYLSPNGKALRPNEVTAGELSSGQFLAVYAHPVRTKDLTDDEIDALVDSACESQMPMDMFARAVIAADREKNK